MSLWVGDLTWMVLLVSSELSQALGVSSYWLGAHMPDGHLGWLSFFTFLSYSSSRLAWAHSHGEGRSVRASTNPVAQTPWKPLEQNAYVIFAIIPPATLWPNPESRDGEIDPTLLVGRTAKSHDKEGVLQGAVQSWGFQCKVQHPMILWGC